MQLFQHLTFKVFPLILAGFISAEDLAASNLEFVNVALVENPAVADIKISPDGKYMGLLVPVDGRNVLSIIETESRKSVNLLKFESNRQIGEFHWANEERLLMRLDYFQSWYAAPVSAGEWFSVNIDGKKKENVFGFRSFTGSSSKIKTHEAGGARASGQIVDLLRDDSKHILMSATPFDPDGDRRSKLYRINIYNSRSKLLETSPVENATFATDKSGEVRFVAGTTKDLLDKVFYRSDAEESWQLFSESQISEGAIQPLAFADANSLYVSDSSASDLAGIYLYDLETRKKTLIHQDSESDPTNFWYSQATGELYAVEYETTLPKYVFVGDGPQVSRLKSLLSAFPGQQVRVVSQTNDESAAVILIYSDRNPGDYYLFDAQTNQLQFLTTAMPKVDPSGLMPMTPLKFKSRDGHDMVGYLTLPAMAEGDPLPPLVVNPHGGPIGVRDRWRYNSEVQLLAQEGFAVLQVNFRGSGGYGRNWMEAGFKTWGSHIQFDIIDATAEVLRQNFADPDRVCIYGASFGGYSALMAPILEPNMFRCAVGFVGVYDLQMLYERGDVADRASGISFLEKVIGRDDGQLRAFSPIYRADELNLPVLIIHGEQDPRAPVEHAEAMIESLENAGKPYEKLMFEKEGHGLYDTEARADMYRTIVGFLRRNLTDK